LHHLDRINQLDRDADAERDFAEVMDIYSSYVELPPVPTPPGTDEDVDGVENVVMTGNLTERIATLKSQCTTALGKELFNQAYQMMKSGTKSEEDLETAVVKLLGSSKRMFFSMIAQIIFCEHSLD